MIQFHIVNKDKSFSGSMETNLSWPPGWGQETQMLLQPNLTPAGAACVSSIWFDSSRCSWGRDGGTRVPWRLTRGWRFGKSSLTFDVGAWGMDSPHPPHHLRGLYLAAWPFQMTSGHCPCQSRFCCCWRALRRSQVCSETLPCLCWLSGRQRASTDELSLFEGASALWSSQGVH